MLCRKRAFPGKRLESIVAAVHLLTVSLQAKTAEAGLGDGF